MASTPTPEEFTADESARAERDDEPTFYTAVEIAERAPRKVEWVAEPWLARGALTLLDGKPKTAGKTTFLSHLIAKVVTGGDFLGETTQRTGVVLLTEERPLTFRRVLERAGLLGNPDLQVLFRDDVHGQTWDGVARLARQHCDRIGATLLVVDTLSAFSVGYERSPQAMRRALEPLYHAARAGLSVLAVRHERKSGGEVGESGLGSTIMTAGVDIVLALQRPKNYTGNGRTLHARSRFDETPEATPIELRDGEFIRLESLDIAAEEVERALFAAAPTDSDEAETADELMLETGLRKTTARDALERLCAKNRLMRLGSGTKGNPYRYYRLPLELVP